MTVPVSVQEHIRSLAMAGVSERKIARVTGLSRNTVSKYVNRVDYSPKPCKRASRSKVDAFSQVVVSWLLQDEEMPVKQRHTAKRVYDRLVVEHGFTGSYSSVSRWVKRWRVAHRELGEGFSELVWEPGVAQVDYGQANAVIAGTEMVVHILVVSFPFSNARFVVASPGENAQCVCQGLREIFEHIGRAPRRLVFDNATGVGHRDSKGNVKETALFQAFRLHYGCGLRFTNPYSGNEKGNVENAVGFLRRNFMVPMPAAQCLDGLSAAFLKKCDALLDSRHYRKDVVVRDLFDQELKACLVLPGIGFDACTWEMRMVDKVGNIRVDDNRYQAGSEHAGKQLQIGISAREITILDMDGSFIARHQRVYGHKESTVTLPIKLLDALVKRPGSWNESLLRGKLPTVVTSMLDELWRNGGKQEFRRVLRCIRRVAVMTDYQGTIDTLQRLIMAGKTIDFDALLMATKRQTQPVEAPGNLVDLSVYDQLAKQVAR